MSNFEKKIAECMGKLAEINLSVGFTETFMRTGQNAAALAHLQLTRKAGDALRQNLTSLSRLHQASIRQTALKVANVCQLLKVLCYTVYKKRLL